MLDGSNKLSFENRDVRVWTGQGSGLSVCMLLCVGEREAKNLEDELFLCVCVCVSVYMSVEVSFFMLRLWAKLEAATGSSTG